MAVFLRDLPINDGPTLAQFQDALVEVGLVEVGPRNRAKVCLLLAIIIVQLFQLVHIDGKGHHCRFELHKSVLRCVPGLNFRPTLAALGVRAV